MTWTAAAILAVAVVAAVAVGGTNPGMTRVELPEALASKFGAYCLGGAPPSMELRLADDSSPNNDKWVLFLEGGGWCYGATEEATIAACKGRARFHGEKEQDETPDYGGVMSSNSTTNPDFFNWNSAFLHYCDGTSFASSRSDPIESLDADNNTALMYMRGRNIFDADINFLQTEQGMEFATEIILTGGSAGGLAVFFNIDHLAEELVDPR